MRGKHFKKLVKKSGFQVFLLASKLPKPFHYFSHSWLVTVKDGRVRRWEVWRSRNKRHGALGYVHLNMFSAFEGRPKIIGRKRLFKTQLLGVVQGGEGSLAQKMFNFIENEVRNYRHKAWYFFLPGPNCNTFTSWVIKRFPEARFRLPSGSVGSWLA